MDCLKRLFFPAFCIFAITIGAAVNAKAGIVICTADFIPDSDRSGFNGFESIPASFAQVSSIGVIGPYTEGGISVTQFSSTPKALYLQAFHPEGNNGWYPNGGDYGYTQITLLDGSNFSSVGMSIASGSGTGGTLAYSLLLDGSEVFSGGGIALHSFSSGISDYIGFSGGGFDTICLWDRSAGHGNLNAVGIDAIETLNAVPESGSTLLFLSIGIVGVIGYGWRHGEK